MIDKKPPAPPRETTADDNDDCQRCHAPMATDDECEPTDFCHHCAQAIVEELQTQLAASEDARRKAEDNLGKLVNMRDERIAWARDRGFDLATITALAQDYENADISIGQYVDKLRALAYAASEELRQERDEARLDASDVRACNRELVRELEETRAFLRRTAMAGGSIVSSASMTPRQIAIARAADRMLVTPDGYGFVYVPGPRFCACGRVESDCDQSRAACPKADVREDGEESDT